MQIIEPKNDCVSTVKRLQSLWTVNNDTRSRFFGSTVTFLTTVLDKAMIAIGIAIIHRVKTLAMLYLSPCFNVVAKF